MRPHSRKPTKLPHPWNSPGKKTGVGCHFLLQCMKVKSEREVAQSCLTLSDPMDCSLPDSSVHGILQVRVEQYAYLVFLPGRSHGQSSMVSYIPWGCKELDTTERLTHTYVTNVCGQSPECVCENVFQKQQTAFIEQKSAWIISILKSWSHTDSHVQGSLNKGEVGLKGLVMILQVHKALLAFLKESWSHWLM